MFRVQPYKRLTEAIRNEAFEPMLAWGLRMAIAAAVPVIWGIATHNLDPATWIGLTAECICWVELKGTFGQRMRVLLGGAFLAFFFAILGSVTGSMSIWVSTLCMLVVAFLSSLFKNLGDRGSGLAICVYLLFIICNAYPVTDIKGLELRSILVLAGAVWTVVVSLLISLFMPARQPYRRSVALMWKAIADLVTEMAKGWDGKSPRSSIRDVYIKEKELRTAIDASLTFHTATAQQTTQAKHEYQLAQLRKATALVGTHIIAIGGELESVSAKDMDVALQLKLSALFSALQQAAGRMAIYVLTLRPEERLLLVSRISRLNNLVQLLKEYRLDNDPHLAAILFRIIHLSERLIKLFESCMAQLAAMGEDLPVFRSYSLFKTLYTLHPRHWLQNIRLLFNFNTFTTRYALRAAVAATVGMFIYKWFDIDHGYWLPFSVMIILQPYFGATFKKAMQRIAGTLAGGLLGGLLLRVHTGMYIREILLCLSFIFMIYYLRRNYAIAAFIITLNLVLLFNLEIPVTPGLIITRALATIGGAGLAIVAGFVLLPHWDRKWLPRHLADAIKANYEYFCYTFFSDEPLADWIRYKRNAETRNSNAFDSFNRYMQEPGSRKKPYGTYYQLITHNVRLTRELNNVHIEEESLVNTERIEATADQQTVLNDCLYQFNRDIQLLGPLGPASKVSIANAGEIYRSSLQLNEHQLLYLEKMTIELREMYFDLQKLVAARDK